MIQQASELSSEPRLQQFFGDHEQKNLDTVYINVWRPLFYPGAWTPVKLEDIASFPYYNG
jgi:hypothetical protein